MSHIFDALQRSEAERSGIELDTFDLPTELLEMAESATAHLIPAAPESLPADLQAVVSQIPQVIPTAAAPAPSLWPEFESLPVSLPQFSKLVAVIEKDSLAAEKFRFLAVRLRQLQQSRPLKKLLITSTIPEEGKSMVAANLACTLGSRRQQKTLLLEGDLRRPGLRDQFGMGRVPGLSECLQGNVNLQSCVYRMDALGVWVLPAGHAPQNPLELMQSGKLSSVMDQLTYWFDWIVIDSPPVLPLADTSVWGRLADGILLVTRQGKTEKQALQRGLEVLEKSKLLGALLNGSTNASHTDYYHRYGSPSNAQDRSEKAAKA